MDAAQVSEGAQRLIRARSTAMDRRPSGETPTPTDAPAANDRLELRPLTSLPGQESQPDLSRGGRRLAFIATDRGGVTDLYLLELAGGGVPIRLTGDDALQGDPTFDPSGRRLAYYHDGRGAPEVWLRDLETGEARRLTGLPSSSVYDLAWSPDGRWLAVAVRPRPATPVAIHLYAFASGELRPLTAPPAGFDGDIYLSWSPDAEILAFVRVRDRGESDLYTVGLAGEPSARRVTRLSAVLRGSGWNRSGDALFFLRYQPGRNSLWRVPLAGGEPRAVADLGERPIDLAVNAESRRRRHLLRLQPRRQLAALAAACGGRAAGGGDRRRRLPSARPRFRRFGLQP